MTRLVQLETLLQDLQNGNRRVLARAISHIENNSRQAAAILAQLYPHTGQARIIGITGAPGTGKSSLVNALTKHIRGLDQTVAIIAVDPSSPFTQGAILGDRIRMQDLAGDVGVFIRSMAARGSLGGLATTTLDVSRVLDASGFDVVIIETVGAGQSEVAIADAAQTTLVIEAPGLGDDIQATKAGILEIADILVVNKADNPLANKTAGVLRAMLDLGHRHIMVAHHGKQMLMADSSTPSAEIDTWPVPVLKTIATSDEGIAELYAAIQDHAQHLSETGLGMQRTRHHLQIELRDRLREALLTRFLAGVADPTLDDLIGRMLNRTVAPAEAVGILLDEEVNP